MRFRFLGGPVHCRAPRTTPVRGSTRGLYTSMRGRGAGFKYLEAEPTPHDAGSTAQSMSRLAQNTFFTIIRYVERRLWLRPLTRDGRFPARIFFTLARIQPDCGCLSICRLARYHEMLEPQTMRSFDSVMVFQPSPRAPLNACREGPSCNSFTVTESAQRLVSCIERLFYHCMVSRSECDAQKLVLRPFRSLYNTYCSLGLKQTLCATRMGSSE